MSTRPYFPPILNASDIQNIRRDTPTVYSLPINDDMGDVEPGSIVTISGNPAMVRLIRCDQWEWLASVDSPDVDFVPNIAVDNTETSYVCFGVQANENPTFYNQGNEDAELAPILSATGPYMVIGRLSKDGKWLWRVYMDNLNQASTDNDQNLNYLGVDRQNNLFVSASMNTDSGDTINLYDVNEIAYFVNRVTAYGRWFPIIKLLNNGTWSWNAMAIISNTADNSDVESSLVASVTDTQHTYALFNMLKSNVYFELFDRDENSTISQSEGPIGEREVHRLCRLNSSGYWAWMAYIEGPGELVQRNQSGNLVCLYDDAEENQKEIYVLSLFDNNNVEIEYYDRDGTNSYTSNLSNVSNHLAVGKILDTGFWQWYARIEGIEMANANIATDSNGDVYVSCVVGSGNTFSFYNRDENKTFPDGNLADTSLIVCKLSRDGYWQWCAIVTPYSDTDSIYAHNLEVEKDVLYLRFSVPAATNIELYNASSFLPDMTIPGLVGYSQQYIIECSIDGVWKSVKSIRLDPVMASENKLVRTKLRNNNMYAAGSTNVAPNLVDRDGEIHVEGRVPTNGQVFIAKSSHEEQSVPIGIVLRLSDGHAVVQTGGVVIYNLQTLVIGSKYYLKCGEGTDVLASLTLDEFTNGYPNRYVGVAIAENKLQLATI